jgi:transcriptional regulator GlxA family with amidase domain
MTRNVAIMIFDDVEVLDFCGPFEVFNVANHFSDTFFNVYLIAPEQRTILARNGLKVIPDYDLIRAPAPDILLIPGGRGTRPLLHNQAVIDYIQQQAGRVERLLSVCTGAYLLAKADLLNGLQATTHHTGFELLAQLAPAATLVRDVKYVDNGRIVLSGGISAGINMSLYIVGQLLDGAVAQGTADYMEYDWQWSPVE